MYTELSVAGGTTGTLIPNGSALQGANVVGTLTFCAAVNFRARTPSIRIPAIPADCWRSGRASLSATRRNIILDAVDKQLNKDFRNQAADKSYPHPEHIFLKASKPNYKNA